MTTIGEVLRLQLFGGDCGGVNQENPGSLVKELLRKQEEERKRREQDAEKTKRQS